MAKEMPSQEYLKECFNYDPSTGVLVWKYRPIQHFKDARAHKIWNTKFLGKVAGTAQSDGVKITLSTLRTMAHRVIWKLVFGAEPAMLIDHKNGNPLDNTLSNLREASYTENNRNRKIIACKVGLKGVVLRKDSGKFRARINVGGGNKWLGTYSTPEEAHQAYCTAADKYHGIFANHGN